MKVRASVKPYPQCPHCQVVLRRKGVGRKGGRVVRVICKKGKHKQRQG